MHCPGCGHENPPENRFCGGCGVPLSQVCSSCGHENAPDHRFCGECGASLSDPARSVQERDPRSYTPKHLADKILQSKSALEGERKQVTVLFADVKGSMELAEELDAEEWHALLDRFFKVLTDGVHRFEGTVNQYTGDGIMALFGAPLAHEDHAQRACFAALYLQDELRKSADELRRIEGHNFSVRIGLNSGTVVVGKIGDDLRMDYTAQGHTVGLAHRVEQIAAPDRINLTEHTAALVEGYFKLRDLGEFSLKGVRDPLRVHELEGLGAFRTRLDRSRERGFSQFVGRGREMGILEGSRDQALEANGQVIGVVGDAGVGKSRLCYEFVQSCRAKGIAVYEAHCPAHGKTVPFLPLLELLREYFGLSDRDGDAEARQKIAGTALLLDEAFREMLPLLFDFLGVPDPEQPAPSIEAEGRQRQLFAFVRRLVQVRSEREPGILFVDDLHWIDPASDAFLAQIVEAVSGTRTLLLVNFRPEYHADWMSKSLYQQLPLVPLGPEAIQQLLENLLGEDASLAGLADLIHDRTQGNPFFIEEVVQSLVEAGNLVGQTGAYRLVSAIEALEIPEAVQAVLDARIDRLAELDKRVLQTAAVIGKLFPQPVLERVAEVPGSDLAGALSTLETAEFIVQEALYPEVVYGFRHPLTQDAALHSQLADRRARLHASVADALQGVRADKLDESAALIAYHWEEAGEALEAARWHGRAAAWAGVSDATEADTHWRKVDELLEPLPRSPETDPLRVDAISERLHLASSVGMTENEADGFFSRGERIAVERGDVRRLAVLEVRYAFLKGFYNQFDQLLTHARKSVQIAEGLEDRSVEVFALGVEARGFTWFAQLPELGATLRRGIELAGGDLELGRDIGGYSALLFLELLRADLLAIRGQLAEAASVFGSAIRRAREIGDLQLVQYLSSDAAFTYFLLGDPERALAHGRQAAELAEKNSGPVNILMAAHWLCWAHAAALDWTSVLEAAERVVAISEEGFGLEWRGPALAMRSTAELNLGESELALKSAQDSLAVLREHRNRFFEPFALTSLGRALMQRDAAGEAESALSSAMALINETGMSGYKPLVHEACAELAQLQTDAVSRERELREAQRLFAQMGATAHVDRLARELGL